jgi:hypothetical protein
MNRIIGKIWVFDGFGFVSYSWNALFLEMHLLMSLAVALPSSPSATTSFSISTRRMEGVRDRKTRRLRRMRRTA